MTKLSASGFLGLAAAVRVLAASDDCPIYFNTAPTTFLNPPPLIDSCAFVNSSEFTVSSLQPYEPTNLRFFTNTGSGFMTGTPGFRLDYTYINGPQYARQPMGWFVNNGSIGASTYLWIFSTNILNTGPLNVGDQGFITVEGTNASSMVSLERSGLKAGNNPQLSGFGGGGRNFFGIAQYDNDVAITDLYWGAGDNNRLGTNGQPLNLAQLTGSNFFGGFTLPFPQSPVHEVLQAGFTFTNSVILPRCNFGRFGAYAYTQPLTATSSVMQVVFVATNSEFTTNLQTDVRFTSTFVGNQQRYMSIVQLSYSDFDIVDEFYSTNYLYFLDSSALATNITLYRNLLNPALRRPSTYELTRTEPFEWLFAQPSNVVFSPTLLYDTGHRTNVVDIDYAGYSAQIGQTNSTVVNVFGNRNPALSDPTNFAGRVEVFARNLNTRQTRIRAENFIGIEAKNLTTALPMLDAPFVNFDIGSTNPVLMITNIAPKTVNRLFGQLSAYSAIWENDVTTTNAFGTNVNRVFFHVLILDNCLQAQQPVSLHKFVAHANNLVVGDVLNVNNAMLLDAKSLTIQPDSGITLPVGWNWAPTNVPVLRHLTNSGGISVPLTANFSVTQAVVTTITNIDIPRRQTNYTYITNIVAEPYTNFINHGTVTAASQDIWSRRFENTGLSVNPAALTAQSGLLSIKTLMGLSTNGVITANGDVAITADSFEIRDTAITAGTETNQVGQFIPGALQLVGTNRFSDGGTNANNDWTVTAGFRAFRRPLTGDLLGTRITSTGRRHALIEHVWAGQDRGASTNGYVNNLALGQLVLDGPFNNLFSFQGPDGTNQYALYIDYLDLRNEATNYNQTISLAPNFSIYFADASVPPLKLSTHASGRLHWVRDYTGLFSSTNFVYVRTNAYGVVSNVFTFNTGLVRSKDLDSDFDFLVNAEDPEPLFTPLDVDLFIRPQVAGAPSMPGMTLSWTALAFAENRVEYTADVATPVWHILTNFVNGPVTRRVTVTDPTAGVDFRAYRVRQDPQ